MSSLVTCILHPFDLTGQNLMRAMFGRRATQWPGRLGDPGKIIEIKGPANEIYGVRVTMLFSFDSFSAGAAAFSQRMAMNRSGSQGLASGCRTGFASGL